MVNHPKSGSSTYTKSLAFVTAAKKGYNPKTLLGILKQYNQLSQAEAKITKLEKAGTYEALQQAHTIAVAEKLSASEIDKINAKLALFARFYEDVAIAYSCKTRKDDFRELLFNYKKQQQWKDYHNI